jgi:GT2 family glycosyltransferase/glycosyltransferase involved in cell wall biosynthesis
MESSSSARLAVPATEEEVAQLIADYSAAAERGDGPTALRFIDRLSRVARNNPEIKFLCGVQLLAAGESARAIAMLEAASADRPLPDFEATLVSALSEAGQLEAARARIETALGRFAVAPASKLAQAARTVARMIGPGCAGWVGIAPNLRLYGEVVGKTGPVQVQWREAGDDETHLRLVSPGSDGVAPFNISCGKRTANISVSVDGIDLLGGNGLGIPPDFALDGRATIADGAIEGWVSLGWLPDRSPDLRVTGGNGFVLEVEPSVDPVNPGRHRFSIESGAWEAAGNRIRVLAALPDGTWRALPDAPLVVKPRPARQPRPRKPAPADQESKPIDIVIPVYKGLDETLDCIRSVARTTRGAAEIVVVDDASPEPQLAAALNRLAVAGTITLLRNRHNLGFPRSVNKGIALHRDRDVVILNSDVQVFAGWLERLRAAAYRDEEIGTVTPLTNSGTIASYPGSEDPDCDDKTAASFARLAARVNPETVIDLPTAVGFCMYVKRACLAQVGFFDPVTYGRGYGEENDFCLRATAAGWRHVLTADTFVRHVGGLSFGKTKAALTERNLRLLNLRFPGYDATVADFLARDPGHPARRRLDEARLTGAGGRHAVLVTLPLEGGVRRAVDDRVAALRGQGLAPIIVKQDSDHADRCVLSVDGARFEDLIYRLPDEAEQVIALLRRLDIATIELHHFLGIPGSLIDALDELDAPIDIHVHDYVWFCPRTTLINEANTYCGEPDLASCEACIARNGSALTEDISVRGLRERSARWLSAARKVVVPSEDVARRFRIRFPGIAPEIEPLEHDVEIGRWAGSTTRMLKVAVIGGLNGPKGYDRLLAAARDAAARNLPIEFVIIGYSQDDAPLMATGKVFITGLYNDTEVSALLAREQPTLAFFPSVVPETWCYALSHAMRAGLPIAAFDLGAIAERVRNSKVKAILFPLSISAAELNDALVQTFSVPPELPRPPAVVARQEPHRSAVAVQAPVGNIVPITETRLSRSAMPPNPNGLSATVEILPLVKGLYLFSVQATTPQRIGDDHELTLPALQVGLGPGTPAGQVDFMYGPRTEGAWLCERRDTIVVKVKDASTILMLTSVQLPGMPPLEIEIKRLDNPGSPVTRAARAQPQPQPAPEPPRPAIVQQQIPMRPAAPQPAPVAAPVPPPSWHSQRSIKLAIVAHVQNRGDMSFSEGQWAGAAGHRLAIESFTISPQEGIAPEMIEYKAVTATGMETPWVAGGSPCGTRGMGLPLVGYAVRVKPPASASYTCEYGATLVSGRAVGPARGGTPCRSPDSGDPLEALWVTITEDTGAGIGQDEEQPDAAAKPKRPRAPAGPKFSMFRQPAEPEAN